MWITRLDSELFFADNESVASSVRDSTKYATLSMLASTQQAIFLGIMYGVIILVGYLILNSNESE